jgi:hypothetical protein
MVEGHLPIHPTVKLEDYLSVHLLLLKTFGLVIQCIKFKLPNKIQNNIEKTKTIIKNVSMQIDN